MRDTIKLVTTAREAEYAIYNGKVKVDGVSRKSVHHGIGLMDVVELEGVSDIYRLVPKKGHILEPIKIKSAEKAVKLVKVTSKTTIRKGKTQIGFHDGRSLISDTKVSVGDSCLMQVPEQKINEVLPLEKGSKVLVTKGVNAGQLADVKEIKVTALHVLREFLAPVAFSLEIENPREVLPAFARVRGHEMAKAALEMAEWELWARREGVPLWRVLGGRGGAIEAGVSVGLQENEAALLDRVEAEVEAGYRR